MATKKFKPRIALLTSCTVSRNYDPVLKIQDMPKVASISALCAKWGDTMHQLSPKAQLYTPGEIYAGISFDTVSEIAQEIGHDNAYIVTGGVGLTSLTDEILPYDFTSDKKALHNAHQHVTKEKFIPRIWWGLINKALHDDPSPIASLAEGYDYIVGALPKNFIKYILDDLSSIPMKDLEEKVFIPIPRSMMGSVPKAIRKAFVPYTTDYLEGLAWNRYDKAQRVALQFITNGLAQKSFQMEALQVEAQSADYIHEGVAELDFDALFKEHPTLLEAEDVNHAIHKAKALGLKIGGRHRFAGAWRGATGTIKVDVNKTTIGLAQDALQKMITSGSPKNYVDDDDLLLRIGIFIEAVRKESSDMIFTAKEVVAWGKLMYPKDKIIANTTKISYALSYHVKYLGLEQLSVGSGHAYRIAQ